MGGIDFHEENEFHIKSRRLLGAPETPTMVRFLLRIGVAKNEKQALYILLGVIVVALSATIFLMRDGGGSGDEFITGLDGRQYTFEEYVDLVNQGKDPLIPGDFE